MPGLRSSLLGAAAAALLLAGGGTACAQSGTQVIRVPAGSVVLVLPPGSAPAASVGGPFDIGFPFAGMPGVAGLMHQMNQMLNEEQELFAAPVWTAPDRTIEAALRQLPPLGPGVSGVMVTTVSNGRGTCTQRVIYGGNGAAPKVEVSSTGNGSCGAMQFGRTGPITSPEIRAPQQPGPRTWQVRDLTAPTARVNG